VEVSVEEPELALLVFVEEEVVDAVVAGASTEGAD
jgi:hypothetical protein